MEDLRTRVKGLVGAERLPSLDHVVSDWLIRNPFQLEGVSAEEVDGEKGEEDIALHEGYLFATKPARWWSSMFSWFCSWQAH
eukprot:jgi/Pico_ML_1/52386/g3097.t1